MSTGLSIGLPGHLLQRTRVGMGGLKRCSDERGDVIGEDGVPGNNIGAARWWQQILLYLQQSNGGI